MEGPADATPVMLLARGDQPTKETKLHNKIITQPSIMKLSYVLLALGAVASVGEARRPMLPLSDVPDKDGMVLVRGGRGWKKVHPVTGRTCWPGPNDGPMCKCGVGEICQQKSRFYKGKFCRKCVVPSEVDDDGFVQVRGGRGWLRVNPETGEKCSPGPDDGPVCRCGPKQICTKLLFHGCAPNSCKSTRLRRNLGRWDWYTGKSNEMPPEMKYAISERAQKSRMNKIVGPKDSIGTMLGGAIVNHFFDEDELGWNGGDMYDLLSGI